MNVNMNDYASNFEGTPPVYDGETLAETIKEHHEILSRSRKWTILGDVLLLSDPDPTLRAAGVLQVWSNTAEGVWVWVNHDGVAVEAACPIGD